MAAAVAQVRDRIADAGGDPAAVTLVAVTKGQPVEAVEAALAAGIADLGESYPRSSPPRPTTWSTAADPEVRWHCIGRLQRNKVRQIAPLVHLWQSVDRLSLAGEIARRAPGASVLVQVNVSGADQQGGCPPARVAVGGRGLHRPRPRGPRPHGHRRPRPARGGPARVPRRARAGRPARAAGAVDGHERRPRGRRRRRQPPWSASAARCSRPRGGSAAMGN